MRFLEVQGLLQQPDLAVTAQLAAAALRGLQVLPFSLLQAGVLRIILPIPILADETGPVFDLTAAAMLAGLDENIVTFFPAAGVALVAGIFLMRNGVGLRDE